MKYKKNIRGAGRKPKFSTKELLDIIDMYKNSGYMKGKLMFSDIARFGQELGYKELRYYHLSKNEEVKDLIDEFNKSYITFSGSFRDKNNENSIFNLNVVEFINSNYENKQKLIMYLENYRNNYEMTVKELQTMIGKVKGCELDNEEIKQQVELLKKDNSILKKENNRLKSDYSILSRKVKDMGELELVESLKSTEIVLGDQLKTDNAIDIKELRDDNGADLQVFINKFPELFSD